VTGALGLGPHSKRELEGLSTTLHVVGLIQVPVDDIGNEFAWVLDVAIECLE